MPTDVNTPERPTETTAQESIRRMVIRMGGRLLGTLTQGLNKYPGPVKVGGRMVEHLAHAHDHLNSVKPTDLQMQSWCSPETYKHVPLTLEQIVHLEHAACRIFLMLEEDAKARNAKLYAEWEKGGQAQ